MFDILIDETITRHKYHPDTLSAWSHKLIVCRCRHCQRVYDDRQMRIVTGSRSEYCERCVPPQKRGSLYDDGFCPACAEKVVRRRMALGDKFGGYVL